MTAGSREADGRRAIQAISPDEIKRTARRARIGDTVKVMDPRKADDDGFGRVVKARIVAKYPHIVALDNGMSVTYVQLAEYYRGKRYVP